MAWKIFCIFLCFTALQVTAEDSAKRSWVNMWINVMDDVSIDPALKAEFMRENRKLLKAPPIPEWNCPVFDHGEAATSVNALKPHDISVVAAFGDSITSGNGLGAATLADCADENRGESWSVGVEGGLSEGILTMPNVLKKYNPNLNGGSTCSIPNYHPLSMLNRAHPGGSNIDLEKQSLQMVELMRRNVDINMDTDWKIVTLFMGGNDLCRYCNHGIGDPENPYSAENYVASVNSSLHILMNHVPRVFVNLVPMFDVSAVTNISRNVVCDIIHRYACMGAVNDTTRAVLKSLQLAYYAGLKDLVDSGIFERDDFTVALQHHLVNIELQATDDGVWDNSMFAPDCFHLNRKGHYGMALMLWNTMFTPIGHKPLAYDLKDNTNYTCPTEEYPYIFTAENSPDEWDDNSDT